jgi:hypothetical protein
MPFLMPVRFSNPPHLQRCTSMGRFAGPDSCLTAQAIISSALRPFFLHLLSIAKPTARPDRLLGSVPKILRTSRLRTTPRLVYEGLIPSQRDWLGPFASYQRRFYLRGHAIRRAAPSGQTSLKPARRTPSASQRWERAEARPHRYAKR